MEITIPHKFQPRKYQLNVLKALDNGIKRAVIVWARRNGKDKTCWNYMIKEAVAIKGTYFYFLPTYSQAKKVIWDNIDIDGFNMLDHIPQALIKSKNSTELKIELINGSVIQLISADEFKKSGVGTNPRGVVLSEYSISNPEVWTFLKPILKVNKGWVIFNFTPRGMNHAFEILQIAKNNPDTWFSEVLTIKETGVLTDEDIEQELREGTPCDIIDQEYFCKFIDGAGQFFTNIDNCLHESELPLIQGRRYQVGIDLAKYQDFTVLTAVDLATWYVYPQERFNQVDWTTQEMTIEAFLRKYNLPRAYVDSTGVGDPIYERLYKKGLPVEPYKFTEQSRMDLLNNLRILLDQRKVKIPNDKELIAELKSFQYMLTPQGRTKVKCPDSLHDDRVMSLALACWNIKNVVIPEHNPVSIMLNKIDYGDKHRGVGADAE